MPTRRVTRKIKMITWLHTEVLEYDFSYDYVTDWCLLHTSTCKTKEWNIVLIFHSDFMIFFGDFHVLFFILNIFMCWWQDLVVGVEWVLTGVVTTDTPVKTILLNIWYSPHEFSRNDTTNDTPVKWWFTLTHLGTV